MKSNNLYIDRIFKAIADPTRREIFHALVVASVSMPINKITEQFEISRQGVTKHIKTLEEAGLIQIVVKGRERYCKADTEPLKLIDSWVSFYEKFWGTSLGKLEEHLNKKG